MNLRLLPNGQIHLISYYFSSVLTQMLSCVFSACCLNMDILPSYLPTSHFTPLHHFSFSTLENFDNILKDETWSVLSPIAGYLYLVVKCFQS